MLTPARRATSRSEASAPCSVNVARAAVRRWAWLRRPSARAGPSADLGLTSLIAVSPLLLNEALLRIIGALLRYMPGFILPATTPEVTD
jgi:hypothetical protein